jgi:hypothetical protein
MESKQIDTILSDYDGTLRPTTSVREMAGLGGWMYDGDDRHTVLGASAKSVMTVSKVKKVCDNTKYMRSKKFRELIDSFLKT